MQGNKRSRHLPDADRLSVLAATLLLAYALTHFVDLPGRELDLQLPGFYLAVQLNMQTLVAFLAAGLTASGTDWLLRDHPAIKSGATVQHWLLPALTAWVIGMPLFQLPLGTLWWAAFAFGGALLMLVMVAEYIAVDVQDVRYPAAAAGITAVSFALYLMLAIVIRSLELRLFLVLPALALAGSLVSLRTLHLRLNGQWKLLECALLTAIVVQIAAALHYWPISPISFGLAVLGPAYALTSLISSLSEGESIRQAFVEPLLALFLLWGGAFWMR